MGRHELQIIESHDSRIYADGIAGAIYGQTPPLVNAARRAGQWQTYDIVFLAPRFKGKRLAEPAYFTVFCGTACWCRTTRPRWGRRARRRWQATRPSKPAGPVLLQFHHSAVQFPQHLDPAAVGLRGRVPCQTIDNQTGRKRGQAPFAGTALRGAAHKRCLSPFRPAPCPLPRGRKRGQAPFAGTALRVLRTKGACPLFRPAPCPLTPACRLANAFPAGRSAKRRGRCRRVGGRLLRPAGLGLGTRRRRGPEQPHYLRLHRLRASRRGLELRPDLPLRRRPDHRRLRRRRRSGWRNAKAKVDAHYSKQFGQDYKGCTCMATSAT